MVSFIRFEVVVIDVRVDVRDEVLVDADLRLVEILAGNIGSIRLETENLRRAHSRADIGVVLVTRQVPAIAADGLDL